ncbi:MAG: hypothetical protein AB1705_12020 [Verrucomicrobiota bacterium]
MTCGLTSSRLLALAVLLVGLPLHAQTTYTWNGTTGSWSDTTRWSPNGLPGAGDTANIGSGTVTVGADTTIGTLNFSGGAIAGGAVLTIETAFNWTGGSLNHSGTVALGSSAAGTMSGTATKGFSSGTFNIQGTLVWTDTGQVSFAQGIWNISGTFEFQNDSSFVDGFDGAPMVINNSGTVRKTTTTGTTALNNVTFNNLSAGLVDVQSGTISFASGGLNNNGTARAQAGTLAVNAPGSSGGAFDSVSPGVVAFTGGTSTLTNGARLTGTGTNRVAGATVTISGTVGAERLEIASGTLDGLGTLSVTNALYWSGGSLNVQGVLGLLSGCTGTISGTGAKGFAFCRLDNQGTLTWTGAGVINFGQGIVTNSGVFEIQNDSSCVDTFDGAPMVFHNYGTVRKTTATGTTTFNNTVLTNYSGGLVEVQTGTVLFTSGATFNNHGTARAQTGVLTLNAGGTSGGAFESVSPGFVMFTGGTSTLTNGARLMGTGTNRVAGATVTTSGAVGAERLEIVSGTLNGTGTLDVTNEFHWSGGTFSHTGTATLLAGGAGTISGAGAKSYGGGSFNNQGTLTWTGAGVINFSQGTWNNSGVFEIQNDSSFVDVFDGAPLVINNSGTVRKVTATGTTTFNNITFNNAASGLVDAQTGSFNFASGAFNNNGTARTQTGALTVNTGGTGGGAFEQTGSGSVWFTGGTTTLTNGAQLAGVIRLSGGALTLQAAVAVDGLEITGGTLSGAGSVTITNAFTWTGGTVSLTGTVTLLPGGNATLGGSGSFFLGGFDNQGTVEWTGTAQLRGTTWNNSGTLRKTTTTGTVYLSNLTTLNNTGLLECVSGFLQVDGSTSFNNHGVVRADGGYIYLYPTGTGTNSGTYVSQGTNYVYLAVGGTHVLSGGTAFLGTGTTYIGNTTLRLAGSVGAERVHLYGDSAVINGSGTLTITNLFDWSGGTVAGTNTITLLAGGSGAISGANHKYLSSTNLVFNNQGTLVWTGTGNLNFNAGTWNNSGTFEAQTDAYFYDSNGSTGASVLNNSGTFRKNTAGITRVQSMGVFYNSGTVECLSGNLYVYGTCAFHNHGVVRADGGHLDLFPDGTGTNSGAYISTGTNYVYLSGSGTHVLADGTTFRGTGTNYNSSTLRLAGNAAAERLSLTGGTVNGQGSLSITNLFDWSGGVLGGTNTVTLLAGGTGTISGNNTKYLSSTNLVFNNQGSLVWTGTGYIDFNGGTWNNSGTFEARTDSYFYDSNGGTGISVLNNSGTFRKTTASGITYVQHITRFNNTGTVENQSGRLYLYGTGSFHNHGVVQASGSHVDIFPDATGTNSGTYISTGANFVYLSGSGTHVLTDGTAFLGTGTNYNSSTLRLAGNAGAERLSLTGGTVNGQGSLTITNLFDWSGGTLAGTNTITLLAGGSGTFGGSNHKYLSSTNLVFNNQGSLVWTGTGYLDFNGGIWNNSGTFEARTDSYFYDSNGGTGISVLNNSGTFRKTTASGITYVQHITRFNNTGTVENQSGRLYLYGTGSFHNHGVVQASGSHVDIFPDATGTNSGTYISTGANFVYLSGSGTHVLADGTAFRGTGTNYNSSTLRLAGNAGAERLSLAGGTVNGQGSLTITNLFDWSGGTLAGTNTITLLAGGSGAISGVNHKYLSSTNLVFNNQGSLVWTGTGYLDFNGGTWNNSGTFDARTDSYFYDSNGATGASAFNNSGTFRKSATTGTTYVQSLGAFNNTGAFEVHSGIVSLTGDYAPASSSTHRFAVGGYAAGTGYGRLSVSGALTLSGQLDVMLTNSFMPTNAATFAVLTGTRTGTFSSVTGRNIGGGLYFNPLYSSSAVTLTVADGTPSITASSAAWVDGKFQFRLNGIANETYRIDASTNLVDWAAISTNAIPGAAFLDFVDNDSANFTNRFYRAVFLP